MKMTNDLNYLFKTKILVSLRDGKYLFFHQSEFCLPGWNTAQHKNIFRTLIFRVLCHLV